MTYSVIRIVQEDILNNVYDWKTKLIETIEEIKNGGFHFKYIFINGGRILELSIYLRVINDSIE